MLEKAWASAGTARVMMKSVKLEWVLNNIDRATAMLDKALEKHPDFSKVGASNDIGVVAVLSAVCLSSFG